MTETKEIWSTIGVIPETTPAGTLWDVWIIQQSNHGNLRRKKISLSDIPIAAEDSSDGSGVIPGGAQ